MNAKINKLKLCSVITSMVMLSACATTQPMYYWGSYQENVYAGFKGQNTSPEAQIAALEADEQVSRAKNLPVPPGFHAHLGYLYAQIGKLDLAAKEFNAEKVAYPESAQYMDFLLKPKKTEK